MNAEEVARVLGCSSKTVRRHLEKGTITAGRKASGELKISEDQVEKLRLILELEDTSRHVHPTASIGRPDQADMSRQVETDIEQRLASLAQSIANLNTAVDSQTRRITELTKRVADLEARNYPTIAENVPVPPSPALSTSDISPPKVPQNRPSTRNKSDLPDGCILASEFAKIHAMAPSTFAHHTEYGISGEKVDVMRRPKPGFTSREERYLTKGQQTGAIAFWRKRKVAFSECENATCFCHTAIK